MNVRIAGLAVVAILDCLAGCKGSVPPRTYAVCMSSRPCFDPSKDPYWEDPRWDKNLLDAVQSAVHDPVDVTDMSAPGLHATVKFTFQDGIIEYPEITQGTGDAEMDKLMLHQLAAAQAPKPTGLRSDEPHEFIMDLDMPTPFESLQYGIYDAIDYAKIYPKEAVIEGAQGITTVVFDYADGKASDISMIKSSESKILDKASVGTVTRAIMPPEPVIYAGKILHMEVLFCYALYQSDRDKSRCPTGRNVILVTGTRIKRVDIQPVPTTRGR